MSITPSASRILCYVTDRAGLRTRLLHERRWNSGERGAYSKSPFAALLGNIGDAAAAGVDWIQVREKDLAAGDCASLTQSALQVCSEAAAKVLVNDRVDVAMAEHAAGVHLGENSLPVREVRRLVSSYAGAARGGFLAGVSCHSLASAQAAADGGADYVLFGPVFSTPSKAAFGSAQGLRRLAEVCRAVHIPVLAIGGIRVENAGYCADSGAAGFAAIRLFQEASELAEVIAQLRALR